MTVVWPDARTGKGAPAKNAGGRRVLFSEGIQLRSRTGCLGAQNSTPPDGKTPAGFMD